MRRLGIPQERIALCLGAAQQPISDHLPKMAVLPNPVNADLKRGFPHFLPSFARCRTYMLARLLRAVRSHSCLN